MSIENLFEHADGGFYCLLVLDAPMKHPSTGEWIDGVVYMGSDGKVRSTSLERFAERFTKIDKYEGDDPEVEAMIRRCNPESDFAMEDVWASWHEAESKQTYAIVELAVASTLIAHGWNDSGLIRSLEWDDKKLISSSIELTQSDMARILATYDVETTPVADGYRFKVSKIT